MVKLLSMLLGFLMGPKALADDISQLYPSVNLHEDHWKYLLILIQNKMDLNGDILVGVVTKLIFGV